MGISRGLKGALALVVVTAALPVVALTGAAAESTGQATGPAAPTAVGPAVRRAPATTSAPATTPAPATASAPTSRAGARASTGLGIRWQSNQPAMGTFYRWQHPDGSSGVEEQFSTPAIGDLFADGHTVAVVGGLDGKIREYEVATGNLVRSFSVAPGVPGIVISSPVLANLYGDGKLEIIVGFMPQTSLDYQFSGDTVMVFDGFGTKKWGKRTCNPDEPGKFCDVFASPVVADIEGNGKPDVIVTSQDQFVHVWRGADGSNVPGFPFKLFDTTWSTPAVADLYGNGQHEIVVASDVADVTCAGNPQLGCKQGGLIRVIGPTGQELHRFNMQGEIPVSSPAIGHIWGPGNAPQIVVGAGLLYNNDSSKKIWAFDANLNPMAGWPRVMPGITHASVALADVDGSGLDTIYAATEDGTISALRGDGSLRWSACNNYFGTGCTGNARGRSSPVVADINHDGHLDLIDVSEQTIRVYGAATGTLEDTVRLHSFVIAATPTVLSLDGHATVFIHGLTDNPPLNQRDANDADLLVRLETLSPLGAAPWPTFHADWSHSGADVAHRLLPPGGPPTAPGRPKAVAGYPLDGRVVLTWAEPDTGGVPLTGFTVTPSTSGGPLAARPFSPTATIGGYFADVTGLTNGTAYTFIVSATNKLGTGPTSAASSPVTPTAVRSPNLSFVQAAYTDFLGRDPAPIEAALYASGLDRGVITRGSVVTTLSSSTEWVRALVNQLYQDTLGRPGDSGGVAYWTNRIRLRLNTVAEVAARFYASDEYYAGIGGGTDSSWVRDLYKKLLGRTADQGGLDYWVGQIAATNRTSVALRFFQSSESCHARVRRQFTKLLGRDPDPGGWDYWSTQVAKTGELTLAANLAASSEYYTRAHQRFP
ncbi:MAG: repeat-containing protein [Acidimicrobiales bacterium]|nr:repeat-containing protein [Acidimicrobiales bacterium]